jgi:hypothetical protein
LKEQVLTASQPAPRLVANNYYMQSGNVDICSCNSTPLERKQAVAAPPTDAAAWENLPRWPAKHNMLYKYGAKIQEIATSKLQKDLQAH